MKKMVHLKVNWIKYGFETKAIFISIMTTVAVNNLNELSNVRKD